MVRWWMLVMTGLSLGACSSAGDAQVEPNEDESPEVQGAVKTCGAAASKSADVAYKRAVARAKIRATCPDYLKNEPQSAQSCNVPAPGACEAYPGGGGATQVEIASDMFTSIQACGSYASVLKSSKWAEPARKALLGTLDYSALVGDLDPRTGRGLQKALEQGITLRSHAGGSYGPATTLHFKAGGKLVAEKLEFDDQKDDIVSKPHNGTYAVRGNQIVLTIDGASTTYNVLAATADEPIRVVAATGATLETTFTMGYECES